MNDEEVMRSVVDAVPSMLAYWDSSLHCRFANRAYERWFGKSPDQLLGTHIKDLLGPQLYELNRPYLERALRGEPQEFERTIPGLNGGPARHSLANYIPNVVDGVVRGVFVIVSDVSELVRARQAVADSEAKYSGIITIAPDAIITTDREHHITIFNRAAETIFGYSKDEVLGQPFQMLLPPSMREMQSKYMDELLRGERPVRAAGLHSDFTGRRKNGEIFPAEASISRLEIGGAPALTVVLHDVTDRRRRDREQRVLVEAGRLFATSLDYKETLSAITKLVAAHLAEWCIVDLVEADSYAIDRIAMSHADPAKADLCEKLTRVPLDLDHGLASQTLRTGKPVLLEIGPELIERAAIDDAHKALLHELAARSAMVVPIHARSGLIGAISFGSSVRARFDSRDVTFGTELASRAGLALDNARLYMEARRATHARDEVLGIVAHDVRSPLNAIRLAATALERQVDEKASAKAHHWLDVIVRSVTRANRLIEDLLDITRIEGGALALHRTPVALSELIADAILSHELAATAASIQLRAEPADSVPSVLVDRDRMMQVLENLIGNAIKFTPPGGEVSIGAERADDMIRCWVRDSGRGIPEAQLPHVFDRFWQAERGTRHGAGLGLPICKGIIEAHGGQLTVESAPERGSTFAFTLPRAPAALVGDEPSDTVH